MSLLPDRDRWILAENLLRQESAASGTEGDFGAYRALLEEEDAAAVRAHAIIDTEAARDHARQAGAVLREAGLSLEKPSVLDLGCGPGAVTEALRSELACREAMGVDISTAAIAYARKHHPLCRFEAAAVRPEASLGGPFDLIHAREFYPFTRTDDLDFQLSHLELCARHIAPGGALLLYLQTTERCLAGNLSRLGGPLSRMGLTPFSRTSAAHPGFAAVLPLGLARAVTSAAKRLAGRQGSFFYLSRRIG